jgi:hypothetical protein
LANPSEEEEEEEEVVRLAVLGHHGRKGSIVAAGEKKKGEAELTDEHTNHVLALHTRRCRVGEQRLTLDRKGENLIECILGNPDLFSRD